LLGGFELGKAGFFPCLPQPGNKQAVLLPVVGGFQGFSFAALGSPS